MNLAWTHGKLPGIPRNIVQCQPFCLLTCLNCLGCLLAAVIIFLRFRLFLDRKSTVTVPMVTHLQPLEDMFFPQTTKAPLAWNGLITLDDPKSTTWWLVDSLWVSLKKSESDSGVGFKGVFYLGGNQSWCKSVVILRNLPWKLHCLWVAVIEWPLFCHKYHPKSRGFWCQETLQANKRNPTKTGEKERHTLRSARFLNPWWCKFDPGQVSLGVGWRQPEEGTAVFCCRKSGRCFLMLGRHGYLRAQSWIQELSPALLNFNIQDSAIDLGLLKGQNWKMS